MTDTTEKTRFERGDEVCFPDPDTPAELAGMVEHIHPRTGRVGVLVTSRDGNAVSPHVVEVSPHRLTFTATPDRLARPKVGPTAECGACGRTIGGARRWCWECDPDSEVNAPGARDHEGVR